MCPVFVCKKSNKRSEMMFQILALLLISLSGPMITTEGRDQPDRQQKVLFGCIEDLILERQQAGEIVDLRGLAEDCLNEHGIGLQIDPVTLSNCTNSTADLQNNCNCNCNCNPTVTCAPPVNATDSYDASDMTSHLLQVIQDQQRQIRSLLSVQEAYNSALLSNTNVAQPKDCQQLRLLNGIIAGGSYTVYPDDNLGPIQVYCDDDGWTVIQRREDGSVNFNRVLDHYRKGFGNVNSEHWLGLDNIHRLTAQTQYQLRIDLQDWDNNVATATYDKFRIGNSGTRYKLILGRYEGDAGDDFSINNYQQFYTEVDNMDNSPYCDGSSGGWWGANLCTGSNLNGEYYDVGHLGKQHGGVVWKEWKGENYSLKRSEMKIRALR